MTTLQITDVHHEKTSIEALRNEYPGLVAFDESGFDVDLDDPELGGDGYAGRSERRILFYACAVDSEMDAGEKAVAEARWVD